MFASRQIEARLQSLRKESAEACRFLRARLTGRASRAYDLETFAPGLTRKARNVTKADLIEEVSRAVDLTRKESETIIHSIFDGIVKALRTGEKTEVRGFGVFHTRQRRPRIGRNPKTGAASRGRADAFLVRR